MFLAMSADNLPRTCRELAENLPRHTMPASIDNLLRPDDVGRELPRGGGAAMVPPGGFAIKRDGFRSFEIQEI